MKNTTHATQGSPAGRGVYPLCPPRTPGWPHLGVAASSSCRTRGLAHMDAAGHVPPSLRVCTVWVHLGRGIPGAKLPRLPPHRALPPASPQTGSTTPGMGVSSSPPAQQPRLRPSVWEAPLPGPSLSSLPGEPLRAFRVQ